MNAGEYGKTPKLVKIVNFGNRVKFDQEIISKCSTSANVFELNEFPGGKSFEKIRT